jgi:hypothetical protein
MLAAFPGAPSHCSTMADRCQDASGSRTNILRSTTLNIWNRCPLWMCTTVTPHRGGGTKNAVFAGTVGAPGLTLALNRR